MNLDHLEGNHLLTGTILQEGVGDFCKLYGYGLCNGNPIPKTAEHKIQYLHFWCLKLLVMKQIQHLFL